MMPLSKEALLQLLLDQDEIDLFESPGGISNRTVNMLKPMAVATHSWGSQGSV